MPRLVGAGPTAAVTWCARTEAQLVNFDSVLALMRHFSYLPQSLRRCKHPARNQLCPVYSLFGDIASLSLNQVYNVLEKKFYLVLYVVYQFRTQPLPFGPQPLGDASAAIYGSRHSARRGMM